MNFVQNENKGMQILYQNALAGSIVNSDLLFRSIKSDLDAASETLNVITLDSLRAKDRELILGVLNLMTYVSSMVEGNLEDRVKTLTNRTSEYVSTGNLEYLDPLIDTIEKFELDLERLDTDVSNVYSAIESCIDDLRSVDAKIVLTEANAHLSTLATHATQLYIIVLTTEGSANQCRMTY